jgi:hypothetical protein
MGSIGPTLSMKGGDKKGISGYYPMSISFI